jgi:hypothetical protein
MVNRKKVDNSSVVAHDDIELLPVPGNRKYSTRKPAKSASEAPEMVKLQGRISHSEPPSELAFGLRRVSFLLPEALAKEFDERGGAAWLALVLRADERVEARGQTAAVPVAVDHGMRPEANTAKPDDHQHCGRRRAGMH